MRLLSVFSRIQLKCLQQCIFFIIGKILHKSNLPTSILSIQNKSRDIHCHMSTALLESSALQSIILQSLVNTLHDSSETIHKVNGDHGFLTLQTCIDTMAVMPHIVGDRVKMTPSCTTLLRFSIKSATHPLKKRTHCIPSVLYFCHPSRQKK